MKKLVYATIGAMAVYLLGAFANASFDIATWDGYARATVAIFMGVAAVGGIAATEIP